MIFSCVIFFFLITIKVVHVFSSPCVSRGKRVLVVPREKNFLRPAQEDGALWYGVLMM